MRWKIIVFKHNQHQIDKARQLSFMDDHEGMMREILKQLKEKLL